MSDLEAQRSRELLECRGQVHNGAAAGISICDKRAAGDGERPGIALAPLNEQHNVLATEGHPRRVRHLA